ncbi:putative XRE-type DNA-binding protein [Povalibacter uvarum]|uniref:Putative XRE-type DNA-binding protein n=1 Tax=Povalibacter uvarum TaxID=732238 RepID=A0A841HIS2_9GAMM|nr:XRE family transcriptional regulator [Povalibacter uvarum]MBB6092200.1 putative XRE-type DNA-binding protein [Povalibacter uvarum]
MTAQTDIKTVHALRTDVALQLARHLGRQQLNQTVAAKRLRIPQPTLSKILNGRVAGVSLELLIRVAVRAGLPMTLQIGEAPEEAGAFVGNVESTRTSSRSRLADEARDALLESARQMTPEERLNAHLKHSQLVGALHRAGKRSS